MHEAQVDHLQSVTDFSMKHSTDKYCHLTFLEMNPVLCF